MKRTLLIVSCCTLFVVAMAIIGQALVVALGITYNSSGLPVDSNPLTNIVSIMAGAGGILSLPLCFATFILGLVVAAERKQNGWVVAIVVAGLLGLVGLVGMAWVLLSANSPVAFVSPLLLVVLVTLLYSLRRDPEAAFRPSTSH